MVGVYNGVYSRLSRVYLGFVGLIKPYARIPSSPRLARPDDSEDPVQTSNLRREAQGPTDGAQYGPWVLGFESLGWC